MPQQIRVGSMPLAANLIRKVDPLYPQAARDARIEGAVQLGAVIGKDGKIAHLEVISGHPLLIPAAIDAVKQWEYRPTLLNGEPIEVKTQIDVNFRLPN
jgi:protein TonB